MIQFGDIRLYKAHKKPLVQALCDLHGVNSKTSKKFVNYAGLSSSIRLGSLSSAKQTKILQLFLQFLSHHSLVIEVESRQKKNIELQNLRSINCQRGLRNAQGLTVRGQKSKSNARTQRRLRGR